MRNKAPALIAIDHDDHHADYVGHTADGRQFFLTEPFVPKSPTGPGQEFVALYLFDAKGVLLEAKIDALGPRATLDIDSRNRIFQQRVDELGEVSFDRIEVAPFAVERFGVEFGLIACAPEDEDDEWSVELEPGNYMAFSEPWDSGDYET